MADTEHRRIPESQGVDLESFRDHLTVVCEHEINHWLRAKVGAADLVQETLLEAHAQISKTVTMTSRELSNWLLRILRNNLADARRRYKCPSRSVGREVTLDGDGGRGAQNVQANISSPSSQYRRNERAEAVLRAIGSLTKEQRRVVELRQFDGLSFVEIARRMKRTPDAARMLWYRAIQRLSLELRTFEDEIQ